MRFTLFFNGLPNFKLPMKFCLPSSPLLWKQKVHSFNACGLTLVSLTRLQWRSESKCCPGLDRESASRYTTPICLQ